MTTYCITNWIFVSFSFIKWNYTKFLVDKEGNPVKRYSPNTEPNVSNRLKLNISWIYSQIFKIGMFSIGEGMSSAI